MYGNVRRLIAIAVFVCCHAYGQCYGNVKIYIANLLQISIVIINNYLLQISIIVINNYFHLIVSVEPKELQSLCQTVLKEFDFVLFHPMPEDNSSAKLGEEKMAYLEDEMVFKIVVLITVVVHKLQYQGKVHQLQCQVQVVLHQLQYQREVVVHWLQCQREVVVHGWQGEMAAHVRPLCV